MSSGTKGSSQTSAENSASLSQLVSTVVPVLVVASVYFAVFLCLRGKLTRNYQPRTYLGSLRPQERSPNLPNGLFNWIGPFNKTPDSHVLNHHSLDAFLLLRYLKISAALCFFGCLITWPVIFPVNATGGGGLKQLDLLSFGNVNTDTMKNKNRFYAHTFIAWIFFGMVFYMVLRESIYFINLRQAYLLSPMYANRISSRTVLFTAVPKDYLDEGKLRRMFGKQVKNLWIANDCKEIEELVEERDKVAMKLEAAEVKLIKTAYKTRAKSMKKGGNHAETAETNGVDGESGALAARWVDPKQRPTHRLKFLIGKKVDTINWCRAELERLVPKVNAMQESYRRGEAKFVGSVFVEYFTQTDAQAAYQSLAHHQPLHMSPRFIGVNPEDVIWKNLKMPWMMRVILNIVTMGIVAAVIIFWAIPVSFVGILSNISALTGPGSPVKFLSFIQDIPPVILGVVQGLLPAILLAVLMALLPIFLRFMARLAGKPTHSSVELRVQNSYFLFQVIQVFLVTTLTSGATASGVAIFKSPGDAPMLLAKSLPSASNFYISYFILQGLNISSRAVAQVIVVILFNVLGKLLDTTPRKMYNRFVSLKGLGWGAVFPVHTLLAVIAITYSIIAPLVLGFAAIGLYLIYLAYRYNLLFVLDCDIDTKGLVYPRALQQTLTGAYLGIVCLIGLFALATAIGPLILMILFLVFVILFHISMNSAIDPLLNSLPVSLSSEEDSLLALEDGHTNGDRLHDTKGTHVTATDKTEVNSDTNANGLPAAPHKKPNFLTKFIAPHKYTDYHTLRRLVPRGYPEVVYDPIVERDAYYHPAISSLTPVLWIPRDEMGISRQECHHSSKVIPMTDECAFFDAKGKMSWDKESARPPIYQEKIYY